MNPNPLMTAIYVLCVTYTSNGVHAHLADGFGVPRIVIVPPSVSSRVPCAKGMSLESPYLRMCRAAPESTMYNNKRYHRRLRPRSEHPTQDQDAPPRALGRAAKNHHTVRHDSQPSAHPIAPVPPQYGV